MLALQKRCQRASQGIFTRGIGTHPQTRRQPRTPPPPPPTPPHLIEWWAVDGELFKAEKFDPKRVLAPLEQDHITNKMRRKELIRHLDQTRLHLRVQGQERYWAAYMKRFQALRDDWEKVVWDPITPPKPKPRNPRLVAEDNHRYVWKDPRRNNFDDSRLEQTTFMSRFDSKADQGPASRRAFFRPTHRDQRYGRQSFRPHDIESFDEVFCDGHGDWKSRDSTQGGSQFTPSGGRPGEHRVFSLSEDDDTSGHNMVQRAAQSARRQQEHSKDACDDSAKDTLFDWAESGSEAECSGGSWDEEEEEDGVGEGFSTEDENDGGGRQPKTSQPRRPERKGWYGDESDLFKDD